MLLLLAMHIVLISGELFYVKIHQVYPYLGQNICRTKKSVYAPSLLLCTYQKYTATRVTNKLEVESVHKSQIFTTFSNYSKYL